MKIDRVRVTVPQFLIRIKKQFEAYFVSECVTDTIVPVTTAAVHADVNSNSRVRTTKVFKPCPHRLNRQNHQMKATFVATAAATMKIRKTAKLLQ